MDVHADGDETGSLLIFKTVAQTLLRRPVNMFLSHNPRVMTLELLLQRAFKIGYIHAARTSTHRLVESLSRLLGRATLGHHLLRLSERIEFLLCQRLSLVDEGGNRFGRR